MVFFHIIGRYMCVKVICEFFLAKTCCFSEKVYMEVLNWKRSSLPTFALNLLQFWAWPASYLELELCTWQLLGLAEKVPWLAPGRPILTLAT